MWVWRRHEEQQQLTLSTVRPVPAFPKLTLGREGRRLENSMLGEQVPGPGLRDSARKVVPSSTKRKSPEGRPLRLKALPPSVDVFWLK